MVIKIHPDTVYRFSRHIAKYCRLLPPEPNTSLLITRYFDELSFPGIDANYYSG